MGLNKLVTISCFLFMRGCKTSRRDSVDPPLLEQALKLIPGNFSTPPNAKYLTKNFFEFT